MRADTGSIDARIEALMRAAKVPGLSMFMLTGNFAHATALGVRANGVEGTVDPHTVFEAASLSKPVVAHAALQLADSGILDLDEPLARYLGAPLENERANAGITARHVLSHTTGLPNWRRSDAPLHAHFSPGSRFSYSGEGYVYLQSAMEHLTGEPLDALVTRLVLDPLGMTKSSYIWTVDIAGDAASGHGRSGEVVTKFMPAKANAAFSLHTTASDYGRFLAASMQGQLLSAISAALWMTPQIYTPKGRFEALEDTAPEITTEIAWGLGWGLEPAAGTFFHWGANPGFTAFAMGSPAEQTGFAVFMNSDMGLSIVPSIAELAMPGPHAAFEWLGL